jgi:hypothetical protein
MLGAKKRLTGYIPKRAALLVKGALISPPGATNHINTLRKYDHVTKPDKALH